MRFIDLDAIYQRQKPQIDAAINKVLSHGQYVMGPEIHQLESVLADFVGVEHAVVTSSGIVSSRSTKLTPQMNQALL